MPERSVGWFFDHHEPFILICYGAVMLSLLGLYVLTARQKRQTEQQIERLQRRLQAPTNETPSEAGS